MESLKVDALIIGGGVAGLWTLDALRRSGRSAMLIEGHRLGGGQTIASQGILHSGLKYSLAGVLTNAAREAREMPVLWRRCIAGEAEPNLSAVAVSSESFHLWGTHSASSRIGLLGAQLGLKVTPRNVPRAEYPSVLRDCPGSVFRVDEQVIAPASLVAALAEPHRDVIVRVDPATEVEFETTAPGVVRRISLHAARRNLTVRVEPRSVILTAGKGNGVLRSRLGLDAGAMQLRPLHYVLLRGGLPEFHGHCVDLNRTRVSITSSRDQNNRVVWQVGGQVSEDGVRMDAESLLELTQSELLAVMPGLDLSETEWTTCRVDRAEGTTRGGARPDSYRLLQEGNVLTAWPTKLVLAPQLAAAILEQMPASAASSPSTSLEALRHWPHPEVASPAWEEIRSWLPYRRRPARRNAA
ncbi:MAG: FAD-dependent oxidoreductase [Planctomycetota bacterium]|nr:FAD-dependent oxidoreductase [Planctomycetota bacterium]